jgi:hypothetical protein
MWLLYTKYNSNARKFRAIYNKPIRVIYINIVHTFVTVILIQMDDENIHEGLYISNILYILYIYMYHIFLKINDLHTFRKILFVATEDGYRLHV